MMTTEQWQNRARLHADALIELEGMLDTLIEVNSAVLLDSPCSVYGQLRTACDELRAEMEAAGIHGKWAGDFRGMRVGLPKGESPCTEGRKDNVCFQTE